MEVLTPPESEPITLAEAKQWLRVEHDDDDATIERLISAARTHCERWLQRSFIATGWRYHVDRLCGTIYLPRAEVVSIDAITYIDQDGDEQTLDEDDYTPILPGRRVIVDRMPSHRYGTIDFTAGFTDDAVPADIVQAIYLMLGHLNENRSAVLTGTIATALPLAVESLLLPHRWGHY